jgi:hypothetical protein
MTRDDIIRMAREAGDVEIDRRGRETFSYDSYGLERFAALVAAAEREACAALAESQSCFCCWGDEGQEMAAHIADVIRGRSLA